MIFQNCNKGTLDQRFDFVYSLEAEFVGDSLSNTVRTHSYFRLFFVFFNTENSF